MPVATGAIPPGWGASVSINGNVGVYQGSDYASCCGVTGSAEALANHFVAFGAGNTSNVGGMLAQNFATTVGTNYGFDVDFGALGGPGVESLSQTLLIQIID